MPGTRDEESPPEAGDRVAESLETTTTTTSPPSRSKAFRKRGLSSLHFCETAIRASPPRRDTAKDWRSRYFLSSPDSCSGSAATFDWGSAFTQRAVHAFRACPEFEFSGVRHLCERLCYLRAYEVRLQRVAGSERKSGVQRKRSFDFVVGVALSADVLLSRNTSRYIRGIPIRTPGGPAVVRSGSEWTEDVSHLRHHYDDGWNVLFVSPTVTLTAEFHVVDPRREGSEADVSRHSSVLTSPCSYCSTRSTSIPLVLL